jgi:hypothetical protein
MCLDLEFIREGREVHEEKTILSSRFFAAFADKLVFKPHQQKKALRPFLVASVLLTQRAWP